MTHRMLALTLSLLVAGCLGVVTGGCAVDTEPEEGKGVSTPLPVYPSPPVLSPDPGIPGQIGEFCLLDGCSADDECYPLPDGDGVGCCIQGTCWRGFRFGPTCVNVGAAQPAETCPSDGDGDGVCSYQDRWYTSC